MYEVKTVKLNKKAKLRSLKQVIDLCLKNKLTFSTTATHINIDMDEGLTEVSFEFKHMNKEVNIQSVELDYDADSKVIDEIYSTKSFDFPAELSIFFTNFPKLTSKQRKAPELPPEPKVVSKLKAGKGHPHYDMELLDNGQFKFGHTSADREQMENTFRFLGKCLDFDVEK